MQYAQHVAATWRHGPGRFDDTVATLTEIVRYATLAPSSHNTQCWRFGVGDDRITIFPDLSRRCPVVDPDDHHLYISLGCAAENLLLAAAAHGLAGQCESTDPDSEGVRIMLSADHVARDPLFDAIPRRQCSRSLYDGSTISSAELALLEAAAEGAGMRVLLLTAPAAIENVLDWVVQGNTAQLHDRAFVRELRQWVRFNDHEALASNDGLMGRVTGNPPLPTWLGRRIFPLLLRPSAENDKLARQIRSSSAIALFVSEHDNPAQWVQAGRSYQRFALQATVLGIRNAFINQPVEVARLRPNFARALGIDAARVDLVVRLGRGPEMPRSLRRPIASVLDAHQ